MKSWQMYVLLAALSCLDSSIVSPQDSSGFTVVGSMSAARAEHTATLLADGTVLIAGGANANVHLATSEVYDAAIRAFLPSGVMSTPRSRHSATLLHSGKVLVAGGEGEIAFLASAELYDPGTGLFRPTGNLLTGREAHTATLLPNGKVLIAGGFDAVTGVTNTAELYDPATDTFTPTGSMMARRAWHVSTLLVNGRVLIAGGFSGSNSGLVESSAEIYDPATGIFSSTGNMTAARELQTANTLANGKVLIAGGIEIIAGYFNYKASAELYDPQTDTFTSTGSMTISHAIHTATSLKTGQILIAGGDTGCGDFGCGAVTSTAELYDPSTGTFTAAGDMTTPRDRHTANLLSNGDVLVAGGANTSNGFLASAELFGARNAAGRPLVFVHGFCSQSSDWATLQSKLYPRLQSLPGQLYPSADTFDVLYDSSADSVKFYLNGAAVNEGAIPEATRFFRIKFYEPFYNPSTGELDPANVAKISVLNKAYELSRAIKRITAITKASDVILVAHSMGGLVSRSYLENMASKGLCYSYGDVVPNYNNGTCAPGTGDAAFASNVADLISIDSPHAGTPIADLDIHFLEPILGDCVADPSVSRDELNPKAFGGAGLIEALNYDGSMIAGTSPSDNRIRIQAVEDYFSDVTDPWDNFHGFLTGYSDDIVLLTNQSIKANLPPRYSRVPVQDMPTAYLSSDSGILSTSACWRPAGPLLFSMLHFIDCLGAQDYTQGNLFSQLSSYVYDRPVDKAFATTALAKPITSSGPR